MYLTLVANNTSVFISQTHYMYWYFVRAVAPDSRICGSYIEHAHANTNRIRRLGQVRIFPQQINGQFRKKHEKRKDSIVGIVRLSCLIRHITNTSELVTLYFNSFFDIIFIIYFEFILDIVLRLYFWHFDFIRHFAFFLDILTLFFLEVQN